MHSRLPRDGLFSTGDGRSTRLSIIVATRCESRLIARPVQLVEPGQKRSFEIGVNYRVRRLTFQSLLDVASFGRSRFALVPPVHRQVYIPVGNQAGEQIVQSVFSSPAVEVTSPFAVSTRRLSIEACDRFHSSGETTGGRNPPSPPRPVPVLGSRRLPSCRYLSGQDVPSSAGTRPARPG